MKKILLLFMAVLTLGVTAHADDGDEFTVDNFKYKVLSEADHEVSITGYVTTPEGELVIPSYVSNKSSRYFVTEIGDNAFQYCSSLTSVTIPNSVTKISDYAFMHCSKLTSLTIPNSVTEIKWGAFSSCSSLTSVTIPNSVTEIGFYAFSSCSSLTSVTIPNSVTKIEGWAFIHCSKLTSVTIPNSVTKINTSAFKGCSSLASVTIPNSVTEIGYFAFSGCSSLTSVTIPTSVTSIDYGPFSDCSSLEAILVEEGNTKYTSEDGVLFNKGMTKLVQCPGTKESYVIPNSVTSIGTYAFSGCGSLTSVTIPNSVTKINSSAFEGCSSLKTIFALPSTPPSCGIDVFNEGPTDAVVYIPNGTLKAYFVANGWSYFIDFREMGVLDITMSETELKLNQGETATITATISKDDDMTIESETWATSNPEVATVEDGVVTAVAAGTATISFTAVDGYGIPHTETCEVTVSDTAGIEGINADSSNAPAEYFNINGVRVNGDNLIPGLYIKRQGNKVEKVLVK